MEAVHANLRKLEFPHSACEAVSYIHTQCQKFSQSGVPSPQELASLIEFIDEFVFSAARGAKPGKKSRRLTSIQQLQLIQVLSDYFTAEQDFNLLCSVFMIIFMVQGRDIEYKVNTLARLLSFSLGVNAVAILNFGGVWVTQQTPTSVHSLAVARHLVQDYICTQPHVCTALQHLPAQSPLFTTNLIAAIGELYSRVGDYSGDYSGYRSPPSAVVELVTVWLRGSEGGQQLSQGGQGGIQAVPGTSPAASLLSWTVMSPLLGEQGETHSLLHHTLVETIQGSQGEKVPLKYLTHLTEGLLAKINAGSYSDDLTCRALDRYGQLVIAALGSSKAKPDKDLLMLINQLPANRLVHIVLNTIN